jgi:hypothetical protein
VRTKEAAGKKRKNFFIVTRFKTKNTVERTYYRIVPWVVKILRGLILREGLKDIYYQEV